MRTDVAVAGSDAPAGGGGSRRRQVDGIVLLVSAMATLFAVGLVLDSVTHSSIPSHPRRPAQPVAFVPPGAVDDFARTDAARSLGVATSGQSWLAVRGVWGVRNHAAAVVRAAPGTSLATTSVGIANGRVSVTAARMAPGIGLAFRCRGARNCWRVEAVPGLGTWNVVKTVGGKETLLGNLGTVPVASGTTVAVDMLDDRISLLVDGVRVRTIRDDALAGETRAGLSLREPASAATARWTDFRMIPRAEPGVATAANATVRDNFARPDAPALGVAPTGQRWTDERAAWAIRNQNAVVMSSQAGPQLATVDVASPNGTVQASLIVVERGAGIVFRYRDGRNYWALEGAPAFATWDVVKVVDGKATRLGNLGLVDTRAGTTVSVRMQGKRLTFFVNGSRARALTDASLMGERRAGLIGTGGKNAHAMWTDFLFAPNGRQP